jgi:knotted carbamoyltransferase YgeW
VKRIGIPEAIESLSNKKTDPLYLSDFLLTWDKSVDELTAVLEVAEIFRYMRKLNITPKVFDSGIAVSIFRDKSTRTRFSFASASNLLGLAVQALDEEKSQIAHGETLRETATMISFLTEVIGIRDDMFLGEGHRYQKRVAESVHQGYLEGVLPRRPTVVNLQCDIDHPTQTMSDLLHVMNYFGGADKLRGKKIAMTWAYSPSYGKPLSVPQGIIGLLTRFGMEVALAHPRGYELMPEVENLARKNALDSGGIFSKVDSMEEAFQDADIVYPKSWAPYAVMEERTQRLKEGDDEGLVALEARCLEANKDFINWTCTDELTKTTREGRALYLHCLPADITGVGCKRGEVEVSVFDRHRVQLYTQAGYKPYIIAAMIFLSKFDKPAGKLTELLNDGKKRVL